MNKVIESLSRLVDEVIKEEMEMFKEYGKLAKKMQKEEKSQEEINNVYIDMAVLFEELKPFEYRVREMYPEMKELFNLLKCQECIKDFNPDLGIE